MSYWLSFVRTLDPNTLRNPGSPEWKQWDSDLGMSRLMIETNKTQMETTPKDQLTKCQFWLGLGRTTAEQ